MFFLQQRTTAGEHWFVSLYLQDNLQVNFSGLKDNIQLEPCAFLTNFEMLSIIFNFMFSLESFYFHSAREWTSHMLGRYPSAELHLISRFIWETSGPSSDLFLPVCVHTCSYVCVEARGNVQFLSQLLPTLFSRRGLSLTLALTCCRGQKLQGSSSRPAQRFLCWCWDSKFRPGKNLTHRTISLWVLFFCFCFVCWCFVWLFVF